MSVIYLKKKDVVKFKVRGVEMEFDHEKLATILGSGENRRRDDDVDAPEEEAEEEDEGNKDDFDWEVVIDKAAVEGESGSGEQFYDAEDKEQDSLDVNEEIPAAVPQSSTQRRNKMLRSRPLLSYRQNSEAVMTKLRVNLRERGQQILGDLEKAKARMRDFSLTPPSPIQTQPLDFFA
ncbi:hypothetical protein Dimus_012861 [Dionaea muscipula]